MQGFATAAERLSDAMHELDEAAQGVQRCIMRAQQGQSDSEFAEVRRNGLVPPPPFCLLTA